MASWERFIQERVYLKNVSPQTVRYYRWVHRAFAHFIERPTQNGLLERIIELKEGGLSPTAINTYLRGLKAYLRWAGFEIRVQFLKTEHKVIATFHPEQVRRLVTFKPTGVNAVRVHMLACLILDTGLRIDEALKLRRADIDFDNLSILVRGKGRKERRVPMSMELRKRLYRYQLKNSHDAVFSTSGGVAISQRNSLRDLKCMCDQLAIKGVRTSWHTLRHTFAAEYLRRGGNLFYLSRILGHADIKTTQVYLRSLGIEDFRAVHDGLSMLTR
jgi:integrase/recombinase XerD